MVVTKVDLIYPTKRKVTIPEYVREAAYTEKTHSLLDYSELNEEE